MNDESTGGAVLGPPHKFQSLLAGQPHLVELPVDVTAQRVFMIRAAASVRERRSASRLVDRMYATRGYQSTPLPAEEDPCGKTFLASEHNEAIGTLTIGLDSSDGLLADSLFGDEVARIRAAGRRVCEFTKLAVDRRAGSQRLLAALFHVGYIYAHRIMDLHELLIEVNPRHVAYYQTMLGFKVIAAARHNQRVNAPAVLLALDLAHAEGQIRIYGGKPEMAATERSAYPHFFSAKDEAGIVGRLRQSDGDLAQVSDSPAARSVSRRAEGALH